MRIEIMLRGIGRPFPSQSQTGVELGHATGRPPGVGAHLRHQKSAVLQRQEVVRDVGERAAGREHEFRPTWLRYVKKEDAVLSPQQSQESATGQDVLVGREMAMV